MRKNLFTKILVAAVALGMAAGMAFVAGSCGKRTADGSTETAKECSVYQGESLLETMTRIYANIYGDTVAFASAEMVEQDNGFVVAIATAEIGNGLYLNFAALAERHGDTLIVCETPEKTSDCKNECENCKPFFTGEWNCYGCEFFGCEEPNGGTNPGGGGPPQN